MKKSKFVFIVLALVLFAWVGVGTASAQDTSNDDTSDDSPGTIIDIALANGNFGNLVAAVQATGLADTLNGEGPFTVFAPTEDAFAAALAALDTTAEALFADTELLTSILTYHVLPMSAPASTILTLHGESVATVNGAEVQISVDGTSVMVNDANVIITDVIASNGIIHVIDSMLLPPSGDDMDDDMSDNMLPDTGHRTGLLAIIGISIALAGLMLFTLSRRLRNLQ